MENIDYSDVKITVLKKIMVEDIHQKYAKENLPLICDKNEEGQEYISKSCSKPEGFCLGAWNGIINHVTLIASGKNSPYVKEDGVSIRSCNDGLHPVIFKIERVID